MKSDPIFRESVFSRVPLSAAEPTAVTVPFLPVIGM